MKMKKSLLIALGAISLSLAGCSNYSSEEESAAASDNVKISISLEEKQDRTITASSKWTDYKYNFKAKSSTSAYTKTLSNLAYTELAAGLDLPKDSYSLYLDATKDSKTVFSGSILDSFDLTSGPKVSVKFIMKPVTGETGSASISVVSPSDFYVKAGVASSPVADVNSCDIVAAAAKGKGNFTFNITKLTANTENYLRFFLYSDENYKRPLSSYTESVIGVAGETIKGTYTIDSSIFENYFYSVTTNSALNDWNSVNSKDLAVILKNDYSLKSLNYISTNDENQKLSKHLDGNLSSIIKGKFLALAPYSLGSSFADKSVVFQWNHQVQNGNDSTSHLENYDYQYSFGNSKTVNLQSLSSKIKFTLTDVPAGTYTKAVIYAPGTKFWTDAKLSISSDTESRTENSDEHFFIDLDNYTVGADKTAVINAMIPPTTIKNYGGSVNYFVLTLIDSNNDYYVSKIQAYSIGSVNGNTFTSISKEYSGTVEKLEHFVELISGVKIATHNVGAYSIWDEGTYFSKAELSGALATDPVFASGYKLMSYEEAEKISDRNFKVLSTNTNNWVKGVKIDINGPNYFYPAFGYFAKNNLNEDVLTSHNAMGCFWTDEALDETNSYFLTIEKDGVGITILNSSTSKYTIRPVKQ